MSNFGNIHGIGDFQNNQGAGAAGYEGNEGNVGIGLTPPSAMGMIPSISERLVPRFSVKTVTFFVSVVDVLVFIATLVYAGVTDRVFDPNNPMAGPSSIVLAEMGGKSTPCIKQWQIWRLFTPIFLHAGIIHLVSNLFFQLHFGFTFEKRWTPFRFTLVYLATGIGASLLSAVASPDSISVGASGALFGLLGANVTYLYMNWVDIPQNKAEACVMALVILINFLFGFGNGEIDNMAHLGGLLTGLFCGALLCPPVNIWPKTRLYQGIGTVLWVVFCLTLIMLLGFTQLTTIPCTF